MNSDKNISLACLGSVALLALSVVGRMITTGLTLSILWGWFIVTTFNAPQLTIAQAYGVALCFAVVRGYQSQGALDSETDTNQVIYDVVASVLIRPAFLLLCGLIVKGLL